MFMLKLSIFKYTKTSSIRSKNKADKRVVNLASKTNKLNLPKYNHLLHLTKSRSNIIAKESYPSFLTLINSYII